MNPEQSVKLMERANELTYFAKSRFKDITSLTFGKPIGGAADKKNSWTYAINQYKSFANAFPINIQLSLESIFLHMKLNPIFDDKFKTESPDTATLISKVKAQAKEERKINAQDPDKKSFYFETKFDDLTAGYLEIKNIPNHSAIFVQTNNSILSNSIMSDFLEIEKEENEPLQTYSIKLLDKNILPSLPMQQMSHYISIFNFMFMQHLKREQQFTCNVKNKNL